MPNRERPPDRSAFFGSRLYPIVDAGALGGRDPGPVLAALADCGVRIVQLRGKGMPAGEMLGWVGAGLPAARRSGLRVVVNDRADVAALAGAAGVHLGQDDLSCATARAMVGPDAIVGLSTHSQVQAREAARERCDYAAIGPVHPTGTKERPDPVVGLAGIRAARRSFPGPLAAIGGIGAGEVGEAIAAGADAVAVVSAIDVTSPGRAADSARTLLEAAGA